MQWFYYLIAVGGYIALYSDLSHTQSMAFSLTCQTDSSLMLISLWPTLWLDSASGSITRHAQSPPEKSPMKALLNLSKSIRATMMGSFTNRIINAKHVMLSSQPDLNIAMFVKCVYLNLIITVFGNCSVI